MRQKCDKTNCKEHEKSSGVRDRWNAWLQKKKKKPFKNAFSWQVEIFHFRLWSHSSDSPGLLFCFFLTIDENNGSERHFGFSFDSSSIGLYQRKFSEASVGEVRLWILAFIISMTNWDDSRLQKKKMRGDMLLAFKCVKSIKAMGINLYSWRRFQEVIDYKQQQKKISNSRESEVIKPNSLATL